VTDRRTVVAETPEEDPKVHDVLRIDKLLWHLRIFKSRSKAKQLIEKGRFRVNGQRVEKAHHLIRQKDVLTIVVGPDVRVIEIVAIPHRRGPAQEAQSCYRTLNDESVAIDA